MAESAYLPLTDTIAPAAAAEVAEAVREAAGRRTPVYPIGGGTTIACGRRPTEPGIGLSTAGLNRIVDHAADDMTITLEAGVTVAQLAGQLADRKQRLPIDVPHASQATIGGIVVTNTSGPRRFAYGTLRDYVIGIRAVDGQGNEFGGGGRVVKNAAGYDLCKMLIGSLGTLAIVTQVTFMVRPLPETTALVTCDVPELAAAERLLAAMIHTKTLPVAVELLAGTNHETGGTLEPMREPNIARLIVGFEGATDDVDWMVEQLGREWGEEGIGRPVIVPRDRADAIWDRLTEIPGDVQVNVRPGAAVEMIERLSAFDPGCSILAHAGNGVIRATFSPQTPLAASSYSELRRVATALGGTLVVLAPPEDVELSAEDIWGPPGGGTGVMRALKERFDPQGILNRGRYVFG